MYEFNYCELVGVLCRGAACDFLLHPKTMLVGWAKLNLGGCMCVHDLMWWTGIQSRVYTSHPVFLN